MNKEPREISERVFNLLNKILRLDVPTRDADSGIEYYKSFYDEDEWVVRFGKTVFITKDELIQSEDPEEYVIQLLEENKQEFCAAIEREKEEIRSLKTFPHPSA